MKEVTKEEIRQNKAAKDNKKKKDKLDKEVKKLIANPTLKSEYDLDPTKALLAAILEELVKLNEGT